MRLVKQQQQEGQQGVLPPDIYSLQQQPGLAADGISTNQNESSRLAASIVSIQRAWRAYILRTRPQQQQQPGGAAHNPLVGGVDSLTGGVGGGAYGSGPAAGAFVGQFGNGHDETGDQLSVNASSEGDDMSLLSADTTADPSPRDLPPRDPTQFLPPPGAAPYSLAARCRIDSDPESIVSDYSEISEPMREHLASVQIIRREDLALGNALGSAASPRHGAPAPPRGIDEDEESYGRRVRKTNLLSLAQEFAALKKVKADALPFDLHEERFRGGAVIVEGGGDEMGSMDYGKKKINGGGSVKDDDSPTDAMELSATNRKGNPSVVDHSAASAGCEPIDENSTGSQSIPDVVLGFPGGSGRVTPSPKDSPRRGIPVRNESPTVVRGAGAAGGNGRGGGGGGEGEGEEFDVYTMETSLPAMDWEHLEEQLLRSAEEEQNRWARCGDREEIRRKLAMSLDDDCFASPSAPLSSLGGCGRGAGGEYAALMQPRKQPLQARLQSGMTLQVCYVNDAAAEHDREEGLGGPGEYRGAPDVIQGAGGAERSGNSGGEVGCVEGGGEDFFSRQAHLQAEAKLALAQVRPMAHMQLQLEKQLKKKSPIAEIVGIPGFECGGRHRRLNRQVVHRMNLAQLQVVVNDLHAQIEVLNAELMHQLVDRDDLHMAQDSMLVDIEDLTGRAQEYADRVNKRAIKKST